MTKPLIRQDTTANDTANNTANNTRAVAVKQADAVIEMTEVEREYATPLGPFYALRGTNLTIGEAQFVAIVGPSGSGKSTLLNLLSGVDRPTAGELVVAGASLEARSTSALARWRSANCGVILQSQQLIPTLTAVENITLAMDLAKAIGKAERKTRSLELLERVGLGGLQNRFPDELSGGQQQRVAIARALANRPALIVADEPTAALDSVTAEGIYEILADITVEDRTTIVCSTHDEWLASKANRIIRVHDGLVES